ncbi:MAG: tRNA (N6-threonylcarbamoyladenosine(37)-N6)-methyltransferase TrmO [Fastidiosipilaceae bacterium]|nr:tRNA (N6-threonylcarbamoyladenosine(37)-N6)-methyltransferase TrmO [Clostridiaceae bacterium]
MKLVQIGCVHSPYKEKKDAPRQGKLKDTVSQIEIFDEYLSAMQRLSDLTHIIVLYWGDRADRSITMSPTPFDSEPIGVFASRSPNRPNPIAFCVCEIVAIKNNIIEVKNLDALDSSPVLDIKAYAAAIDAYPEAQRKGRGVHG